MIDCDPRNNRHSDYNHRNYSQNHLRHRLQRHHPQLRLLHLLHHRQLLPLLPLLPRRLMPRRPGRFPLPPQLYRRPFPAGRPDHRVLLFAGAHCHYNLISFPHSSAASHPILQNPFFSDSAQQDFWPSIYRPAQQEQRAPLPGRGFVSH